jgi:hypothetical protein
LEGRVTTAKSIFGGRSEMEGKHATPEAGVEGSDHHPVAPFFHLGGGSNDGDGLGFKDRV